MGPFPQAAKSSDYDTAMAKLDHMQELVQAWRAALVGAQNEAAAPKEPEKPPEPPAEKAEFFINVTHVPATCPRKSEDGATMKVHYVGKLISTGKIFASSFHTGSEPFRFILGTDDVVEGWNKGLQGMCEGERRRLIVPWDMAYGAAGNKGVPAYSDVQYDFELAELRVPKIPTSKKKGRKSEL